jgi:hypothetical protein
MRFVMHVSMPADKFNESVRDGSAGQKIGRILEEIKPEAAYFCAEDGQRGGFLIVNMDSPRDMPRLAEPFFLYWNARVEFLPTMTAEDLASAGLDDIGRKWA